MDKTGDIDPSLARAARAAPGLNDLSLLDWMGHARPLLLPGVRFNLANHPYLTEIYASKARELVLCKAAQMGLSEYGISYALHACDQRRATVLYLFSTDTAVSDFSTARIGPAIEASPYLQSIIVTARGGVSPSDGRPSKSGADRVTLKRIRDNFLYLRGGRVAPDGSAPQLRSIPADVIVLDELDEMDPRAPALAEKRLGHSLIKERRDISTPTYSGMGIHARYLQSDMREWHVTCGNCGLSQPLNLDNLITSYDQLGRPVRWHTAEDGLTPVLKCAGCAVTLNRLGPGHWRATHPDRTIAGYKVTKLFSAQYELDELITSLQSTDENKRQQTFNQDLAEPYTPRGGQLTSEILDKCALTPTLSLTPNPSPGGRGGQLPLPPGEGWGEGPGSCFAGIDVGRVLHVIIRARDASGSWRLLLAAELDWQQTERTLKQFKVKAAVIDALPETSKARDLQAAFAKNVMWLNYYSQQTTGLRTQQPSTFQPTEGVVNSDRTRTLDVCFAQFMAGTAQHDPGIFAQSQGTLSSSKGHSDTKKAWYAHLTAPVRVISEGSSGTPIAKYIEGAHPDHFAHAENYALIASHAPFENPWRAFVREQMSELAKEKAANDKPKP